MDKTNTVMLSLIQHEVGPRSWETLFLVYDKFTNFTVLWKLDVGVSQMMSY